MESNGLLIRQTHCHNQASNTCSPLSRKAIALSQARVDPDLLPPPSSFGIATLLFYIIISSDSPNTILPNQLREKTTA
ncbi:Uncharacterized protein HZ326_10948 [Fusarium oxysporum f. sp. albedinis]|nr:Uncharacterized protein HZ326_10948 [Fusarium oxysporum f. sp. albedinis]